MNSATNSPSVVFAQLKSSNDYALEISLQVATLSAMEPCSADNIMEAHLSSTLKTQSAGVGTGLRCLDFIRYPPLPTHPILHLPRDILGNLGVPVKVKSKMERVRYPVAGAVKLKSYMNAADSTNLLISTSQPFTPPTCLPLRHGSILAIIPGS